MYKIGIFDSGVGGLTVLKKIIEKMPDSHLVYYGDSKNAPYGDREEKEIKELCLKIGSFLYSNKVDAIVIACNTATAASINELKEKFPIPIIGTIEPGVKAALKTTKNGNIAVIATPATVKMNAYKNIFDIYASENDSLVQKDCKLFCPMIEKGWKIFYDNYLTDEVVRLYLKDIPEETDTLILGCTHYPIIKDNISKYFKKNIVDPAFETTEELLRELSKIRPKNLPSKEEKLKFIISGDKDVFLNFAEPFLGEKIRKISNLDLNK